MIRAGGPPITILTGEYCENDSRVWRHVDLRRHSIYFDRILSDGTFSTGEKTLLQIAASLFNEEVAVNPYTVLSPLDDKHAAIAMRAMSAFTTDEQAPPDPAPCLSF